MTHRWKCLGLFIALLCNAALALGQINSDIILSGPWLIYEEHNFAKKSASNGTVSALIAIAPGIGDNSQNGRDFHTPQLNTNDGYYILSTGIYCLTFDDECAPVETATSLGTDSFPDPDHALLPVKVKLTNGAWNWASRFSSGQYRSPVILILPMPDSYSNEAEWFMRFGKTFDPNGASYSKGGSTSIGVILHYSKGPKSYYNLRGCDSQSPTADNCNTLVQGSNGHLTQLTNVSTLHVEMKAPNAIDACDHHVRRAYPYMMQLLGKDLYSTELSVVDPAYNSDSSGKPQYDHGDQACLKEDCQNPANNCAPTMAMAAAESVSMFGASMTHHMFSVEPLQSLVGDFNQTDVDHKPLLTDEQKDYLLAGTIERLEKDLSPQFPRISQLAYLQQLLQLSSARVQTLIAELEARTTASKIQNQVAQDRDSAKFMANAGDTHDEQVLDLLQNRVDPTEKSLLLDNPAKDAKDCRAPVMHVVPGP